MPPRGTALEEQEWKTRWKVVTFVECRGYEYKGTKIQENQEQVFVSRKQLKNIWYSQCLEVWKQRENSAKERGVVKVKCTQCGQRDMVVEVFKKEQKENFVSRMQDRKEAAIVGLKSSSIPITNGHLLICDCLI